MSIGINTKNHPIFVIIIVGILTVGYIRTVQETLPLPDQVDVTINYIKTLKERLEKMKHKREEVLKVQSRKMHSSASSSSRHHHHHHHHHLEPPQIQIHEMGPAMAVVFITGLDNVATFNNVIRMVREEGVEVASASFQLHGNSTLQIVGEPVIIILPTCHKTSYL